MAKAVVTLEGFEQTRAAVARVPDQATDKLKEVVQVTSFAAAQRAKALAPRDSGLLRDSITASVRGLSGRVTVDARAFYWRFIEYGTKFQAARPFVRTAAELESRDFEERMRRVGHELERDFGASRFL